MSGPFLDKLAPELREKIYGYVLHSSDMPLRHVTHLRPTIKDLDLTGDDSELLFGCEDTRNRDPDLAWISSFDGRLSDNAAIDTAILRASKTVYNEAIKVFYDLNTISIDVALFKFTGILAPLGGDLSLAKHLAVPYIFDLLRLQTLFPKLQTITVYTDGSSFPSTSLFDIGQDLSTSPFIKSVQFVSVGHIEAKCTGKLDPTITVKFKKLFDTWQGYATMSQEALKATAAEILARKERDFASHVYHLYATFRCLDLEDFVEEFVETQSEPFYREMPKTCPALAQGGLWDYALWTWFAVPYGQECKV